MPLDPLDLRYLDAKFEAINASVTLQLLPVRENLGRLNDQVFGDGNGRKGLVRFFDALAFDVRTHKHAGMVAIDRKTVVQIATIAASAATIVAAVFQFWPRG